MILCDYRQVASVLSGQFASILQGILTTGTNKRIFSHKKGACGNVPGPKTCFFHKKRRLRQRTRTKNVFFSQKKAPAAALLDQKRVFFRKKRRLRQHSWTKKTFFCGPVCIYCTPISALWTNFLVFVSVCTGRLAGIYKLRNQLAGTSPEKPLKSIFFQGFEARGPQK